MCVGGDAVPWGICPSVWVTRREVLKEFVVGVQKHQPTRKAPGQQCGHFLEVERGSGRPELWAEARGILLEMVGGTGAPRSSDLVGPLPDVTGSATGARRECLPFPTLSADLHGLNTGNEE